MIQRKRAFTLVEVMVSLAIIAVLLPPIMYGLSLESRMAAAAHNRTQAASLARQKLNDIIANFPVNGLSQASGNFADQGAEFARFTWSAAAAPYNSDTVQDTSSLTEIDLTVTWQESGTPRTYLLSTLIYQNSAASSGGILP